MDNTISFELHFTYTFYSPFANSHAAKIRMTIKGCYLLRTPQNQRAKTALKKHKQGSYSAGSLAEGEL